MPRRLLLATIGAIFPLASLAADIVISPPATGGVAITNAAGSTTRLRVGDDGIVTFPGLTALPVAGTGLCIDVATGRIGTCSPGGGGAGTVTSLIAGTGLTGGTITTSGTIGLANGGVGTAQLADGSVTLAKLATTGCASGQTFVYNGFGWACGAGVSASHPLAILDLGGTPTVSMTGGTTGTILAWTVSGPNWTNSPVLSGSATVSGGLTVGGNAAIQGGLSTNGDLDMTPSNATRGSLRKNGALFLHDRGVNNTALGLQALQDVIAGTDNTFVGALAGNSITSSSRNTAVGVEAMRALAFSNLGTSYIGENTALGYRALFSVNSASTLSGIRNTALGSFALASLAVGSGNVAVGSSALSAGSFATDNNVAVGTGALFQLQSGTGNIGIGHTAGQLMTSGSGNILIGSNGADSESNTTRIGFVGTARTFLSGVRGVTTGSNDAVAVVVDSNGQLGTVSSSRRFKDDIEDMGDASEGLRHLRPVTFTYKADGDAAGKRVQYGLIAEEVAQVYPGLVARAADGQAETVLYHFLAPMLVNEVQKQQRTIDSQRAELDALRAEMADLKRSLGLAR